MRIALVLVVVPACWSSSTNPPPPEQVTREPAPRAAETHPAPHRSGLVEADPGLLEADPVPAHSVWRGRYVCRQGITALQLTIDVTSGTAVSAIFDFGADPRNPGVPAGSFRMTGTIQTSGAELAVRLVPDRWINQPGNYMMVGLDADTDGGRQRMRGAITAPGCQTVELRRVD